MQKVRFWSFMGGDRSHHMGRDRSHHMGGDRSHHMGRGSTFTHAKTVREVKIEAKTL